jgi:hypothetical protein
MQLAHKEPYAELGKTATSLSERRRSWFKNEVEILGSWSSKHRLSISMLCGAVAYLIGWGAIILLTSYSTYEPIGYEGFYYVGKVEVYFTDARGETVLRHHKGVFPSFKFFEMLVAGTAAGVIGVKVAPHSRNREDLIAGVGLMGMVLAWFALVICYSAALL